MNPLVKDMLEATISNDVDTRFLEDLFEHEAKCESIHRVQKTCSHEVVAVKISSCGARVLICQNSYRYNMKCLETRVFNCSGCGNPASECWTIRPI